jgi:L-ribulose-5-phosphate 3-epimerase
VEAEVNAGPAETLREAADEVGLTIHSVHCWANYTYPLSSGDEAELCLGIKATIAALEAGRTLGAETMLLIPGTVCDGTTYREAHDRSQEVIQREILPVAQECGIVLAIENVWNGFLLGAIEYANYVKGFSSPSVSACFDVGNVIFGRPEGWIEVLGDHITSLHLKDFRFEKERSRFGLAKIGEGDIDWGKVRAALERIDFSGWGVLSEAELLRGPIAGVAYNRLNGLARRLGRNAVVESGRNYLTRTLLADVMRRFRKHFA